MSSRTFPEFMARFYRKVVRDLMMDDIYDEAYWTHDDDRERLEREEREWFTEQQQRLYDGPRAPAKRCHPDWVGVDNEPFIVGYGVGLPVSTPEVGLEELVMWAVDNASRVNWSDTFEKFLKKYEVRRR